MKHVLGIQITDDIVVMQMFRIRCFAVVLLQSAAVVSLLFGLHLQPVVAVICAVHCR